MGTYENMQAKLYALQECIANDYKPTQEELEWIEFAEEKITDWASDVEFSF